MELAVPGRESVALATVVPVAGLAVAAIVWTISIGRRSILFAFAINWALMSLAFVVRVQRGWRDTAGRLLLFNLSHNAYSVLSLRHVRARLEACARRSRRG